VRDLGRLDDFLIDVVRSVPGVRSTSAKLAFGGSMRAEVINELPLQDSVWTRRATAAVFVKIEPGKDREVYAALARLPRHREVQVAWMLRLFHSAQADVKLMLIGERTSSLTGFVMSWIRTIPGVLDTQLTTVLDWRILGRPDDFIELTECFPEEPAAEKAAAAAPRAPAEA
jgi:DNA-binding Lrp family transcriptional regulator